MQTIFERFKLNRVILDKLLKLRIPKKRAKDLASVIQTIENLRSEVDRATALLKEAKEKLQSTCTHADKDLSYEESDSQNLYVDRMWDHEATIKCTVCGTILAHHDWTT